MITVKQILNANKYGLSHKDDMIFSQTPLLETVAGLGQDGVDLSSCKIVKGYRFGDAPECGRSFNFRDQYSEKAVSMAKIDNEKECYSACYFKGEKKEYEGFLLEDRGTDGEALIIPINCFEYYGF